MVESQLRMILMNILYGCLSDECSWIVDVAETMIEVRSISDQMKYEVQVMV